MKDVESKLIEIFCHTDDFNKVFINELRTHQLSDGSRKRIKPGNVDDRQPLIGSNLLSKIYGKLFGDKGYISQSLFEKLFIDGIHH